MEWQRAWIYRTGVSCPLGQIQPPKQFYMTAKQVRPIKLNQRSVTVAQSWLMKEKYCSCKTPSKLLEHTHVPWFPQLGSCKNLCRNKNGWQRPPWLVLFWFLLCRGKNIVWNFSLCFGTFDLLVIKFTEPLNSVRIYKNIYYLQGLEACNPSHTKEKLYGFEHLLGLGDCEWIHNGQ